MYTPFFIYYLSIYKKYRIMISRNRFSLGLFPDTCAYADNQKHVEKKAVAELDLKKLIQVDFPDDQYYRSQTNKKQIVLHHTVSGQGVNGDIAWWRSTAAHIALKRFCFRGEEMTTSIPSSASNS